jgi:hypothetical protein
MITSMSEVEAMLSVDKGRVPRGTVAFFQRDPEAPLRKSYGWLAVIVNGFALSLLIAGLTNIGAALLALCGVALTVLALPTRSEEDDRPRKQPMLLLTPEAIAVRDTRGMRSWQFDELEDVLPFVDRDTRGIVVVRKDGKRDFIDTAFFERGEKVGDALVRRLQLRSALRPTGA